MSDRISIGSIEALIAFRSHLITFNQTLADEFSSMRAHWHELGDVWTDDKYREYGEALAEVSKGIDRYLAVTDDHEAHLLRLIERLHAVLDTHL